MPRGWRILGRLRERGVVSARSLTLISEHLALEPCWSLAESLSHKKQDSHLKRFVI